MKKLAAFIILGFINAIIVVVSGFFELLGLLLRWADGEELNNNE